MAPAGPDPVAQKRREAERRGHLAEALAAFSLRIKGYRILERRYRCRTGEIDIIARKGRVIVFVEVKARGESLAAVDAVSHASRQRIRAAGDRWIASQTARGAELSGFSFRYDIVAILPRRWPQHFVDAF